MSPHRISPATATLRAVTALLCLAFTAGGQLFLAANQYNDADSSYFIYGGHAMLGGLQLYTDFWDQKPPGIFLQNAVLEALFGIDFKAYALIHGAALLAACYGIWRSYRSMLGEGAACTAALIFAAAFNLNNYLDFGNRPEFGMSLLELAAFLCLLHGWRKHSASALLLCGLLSGSAFWFKPVGMACFLAAGSAVLMSRRPELWRERMTQLRTLSAGFLLALLPVMCYFALSGQAGEPLLASVLVPLQLADESAPGWAQAAHNLLWRFGPLWWWCSILLISPWQLWRERHSSDSTFHLHLWFLVASLAGILVQRRDHPHYFLQGVAPLVLSATVAWNLLWKFLTDVGFKPLKACLILFFAAQLLLGLRWPLQRQFHYLRHVLPELQAGNREHLLGLRDWIDTHLSPEDDIYYWSHGYQPYIVSERFSPGRISPFLLAHGPVGAKLVLQDLRQVMGAGVELIIENPDVHPEVFAGSATLESAEQRECLALYRRWRDEAFVHTRTLPGTFRLYLRRPEPLLQP